MFNIFVISPYNKVGPQQRINGGTCMMRYKGSIVEAKVEYHQNGDS